MLKNFRLKNVGVDTSVCWDEIRREGKRTLVTEKQIDYNVISACDFFGLCSNVLQIVAAD